MNDIYTIVGIAASSLAAIGFATACYFERRRGNWWRDRADKVEQFFHNEQGQSAYLRVSLKFERDRAESYSAWISRTDQWQAYERSARMAKLGALGNASQRRKREAASHLLTDDQIAANWPNVIGDTGRANIRAGLKTLLADFTKDRANKGIA